MDDVVVKDMWIYNNKLLANFVSNADQADKLFEANFRVVSVLQLNILVNVIQVVNADNAIKISRTGKELHEKNDLFIWSAVFSLYFRDFWIFHRFSSRKIGVYCLHL